MQKNANIPALPEENNFRYRKNRWKAQDKPIPNHTIFGTVK